ncbi:MAG: hypothetical protein MHM6MM_006366 [Cercozoa sp. M6MM]
MKLHITVVRHGETVFNNIGRLQGNASCGGPECDSSLSVTGEAQAHRLSEVLAKRQYEHPFDLAVTSALKRTKQTAAPSIQKFGLPHVALPEWNEIGMGVLEGLMWDDALPQQQYARALEHWQSGNLEFKFCDDIDGAEGVGLGDSLEEVLDRAKKGLRLVSLEAKRRGARHVLLVAHGFILKCIVRLLSGMEAKDVTRERSPPNCSVAELQVTMTSKNGTVGVDSDDIDDDDVSFEFRVLQPLHDILHGTDNLSDAS